MRAYVFTDKALDRYAGRFVWLSINTEKGSNSPFLKKYPVEVWPSFFIIDPKKEAIAIRWVGGATVPQVEKLLDDASKTIKGNQKGIDQTLAHADQLFGERKNAEAAKLYEEALSKAPADWPQYRRALESMLFAQTSSHDNARCAALAEANFARVKNTASAANVAAIGLGCALELPAEDTKRAQLIETLENDSREVIANNKTFMAADDRSSVYDTLISAREDAKDAKGVKKVAAEWATFLEGEAAKAKTAEQRAVFDSHRVGAYLKLGQPERGLPMLQQSEKDLPNDYNPPARMAVLYNAMGKYDAALAASDRALSRAYGPRKLGILRTRADIYAGKGDKVKAKETMEEAIRLAEGMPEGQRSERTIASLKKKRDEIQ
ncbi:MAG TPA: tetratricopeptide repeat protein [Thermoanaerobaculia bacterium]|nr:tetratricopeptide repeat protein [Thermoanaerobaculia bacterium]